MEVMQSVLEERIKGHVADQMVDIPVPSVMKEIEAVVQEEVKLVPQERAQQWTVELRQCLRFWKRQSRWFVEVCRLVPQERVQERDEHSNCGRER